MARKDKRPYASTSHASQGKTVDRVIIAESAASFAAAGREQLYVSVSRGRGQCSIYTDDKCGLLEAASGTSDRMTATELTRRMIDRSRAHDALYPMVQSPPFEPSRWADRER